MYTIYDLEISREVVSTLSYIALTCGIKLKNKPQFNYIIYKLYNYLKDDFNFDNGIVINETLKEKINNFKSIHSELYYPIGDESLEEYYCTFPKYAQNSATSPYIDDEYTTLEDIDDCDDRLYKIPYKFWCDPKNASDYCSVQLEVKHKTTEAITKLISYTSKQILANLDYWELYISTNAAKTAYTITRKSYNTDGNLIKTETLTYSTTYKPTLYDVRVYKVYGDYYPTECYKVTESYTFDETDLLEADSSILNTGDKYYSKDFFQPTSSSEITFDCLIQKHLNGEQTGNKFGIIHSYLGTESKTDGDIYKFLTITSNEDKTTYTGYVSTYPLYATNVNNELGLWFLEWNTTIPVKVFKSDNGEIWEEQTKITGQTYSTDSFAVKSTAISFPGEDIIYSNYPVYYSSKGTNFEEYNILNNKTIEEYNEDISTLALDVDNTFKLYRNSDEDFTLDMMPLGGGFYFGKHKINDSPRFKIVFRPLDYAENLNRKCGVDNYIPNDTVFCESVNLIDYLPFHNNKNYNNVEVMYKNAHLSRWLNSDAPEGEWWKQINEYDTPSTEENMYSSYKTAYYGDRAGFLYNFTNEEKNLLRPFDNFDDYNGLKVSLLQSKDLPATLVYKTRPKFFDACATGSYAVRPYFVKEMKYHRDTSIASLCSTELNGLVSSYNYSWFWGRNRGTNYGQYYDGTSNGSNAYTPRGVKPVVAIDKNTKVKREPDENGIFSLDLPIAETIDVDLHFEIKREVLKDTSKVFETELKIIENISCNFETKRSIGTSDLKYFNIERIVQTECSEKYPLVRNITSPIEKIYPTIREVNYFYNFRFPTKLKTIRNIDAKYPIVRDIIEEFFVEEKFGTKRFITKNTTKRFDVERNVLGIVNKDFKTLRFIRENIDIIFDTVLEIITHTEYNFETERNIENNVDILYPTSLKSTNNIIKLFETNRDIYKQEHLKFDIQRSIRNNVEIDYSIRRFIQSKEEISYDTLRFICEPTILKFNIQRSILNKALNSYPLVRSIKKEELVSLTFDIVRDILNNTNFLANTIRYIQENYSDDIETCRSIVEDIVIINENFKREVLVNMEKNSPTKRFITNDTDKYVSKSNLILYTQLLKEQIADYIDLKISEEFRKRNL